MNRATLEILAARANVVAANYPNDSKLEQAIQYALNNSTASAAATTLLPPVKSVAQAGHGAKNV